MKKILAFILAALTVFSTVGFAAPTVEVTENSEEITETGGGIKISLADKAALSEEEIDYNAPFYGVKVFFEDFETGYTDGESIIGKTTADGNATWALNGSNQISAVAETDETTGNHYVRLSIPSSYTADQTGLAAVLTNAAEGKFFTLYSDQYVSGDNASNYTYMGHIYYSSSGRANQTYNNTSVWKVTDSWYTRDTSVNVPWSGSTATSVTKVMFSPRLAAAPADTTEVLVDNLGLYAKPAAPTLSYTVDVDLPKITISVPEGVEPSAKAAIEAAPEKYFGTVGEFITNAAVSDTEIVLTVKFTEAAKEKLITLSLPSLVNADATASYAVQSVEIADFITLRRGAQLLNLDFDNLDTTPSGEYNDFVKISYNSSSNDNRAVDTDRFGNKYLKIGFKDSGNYPHNYIYFNSSRTANGVYYYSVEEFQPVTSASIASVTGYALYNGSTVAGTTSGNLSTISTKSQWYKRENTFKVPATIEATSDTQLDVESANGVAFTPVGVSGSTKTPYLTNTFFDNFRIYFMPDDTIDYTYAVNGSTVTVTAPEGIDAATAKALCAYPALFFGNGATKAVYTEDNGVGTIEITVTNACTSVTLPKLVNKATDKAYNADEVTIEREVIDYFSVPYGIKDWFYDASGSANVITDETTSISYINVNGSARQGTRTSDVVADALYTYLEKFNPGADEYVQIRLVNAAGGAISANCLVDSSKSQVNVTGGEWTDYYNQFAFHSDDARDMEQLAKIVSVNYPDLWHSTGSKGTFKLAYNGLYHKPLAEALEPIVKPADAKTVIVTYPNGIYEDTAKALEAYYTEYFGDNVDSLTVSGKTVTIKLAANAEEFEIPSLVSEDGTKTSAAVTIFADMKPATDAESTDYSDIYNGMRFHASVTDAQRKSAVEYGWIVARKVTIGDSELTFALSNDNGKTFVTGVSYGDNGNIDKIFHNDVENGKFIFTGVIKGIPEGMEDDVIVARPYIKYLDSGVVFYGNVMTSTLAEVMPTQGE